MINYDAPAICHRNEVQHELAFKLVSNPEEATSPHTTRRPLVGIGQDVEC
jgi:hypothetical protein